MAEDTFDSSIKDSLAFVSGSADLDNGLFFLGDVSGLDSTSPEKRTDQEYNLEDAEYPEGSLVWAKQEGYCYWPALVTTSHSKKKIPGQTHVHFFGYENDFAWIPNKFVKAFHGIDDFKKFVAANCHQWQKDDFVPEKKFEDTYKTAIVLAESLLSMNVEERIQNFGLSSPLIWKLAPRPLTTGLSSKNSPFKIPIANPQVVLNLSAIQSPPSLTDTSGIDSKFPLGSLVWAKMSGYPFWPGFVTLSFEGSFTREGKSGSEYYCQFFNWKNQCAWVSKVEPWGALAEVNSKTSLTLSEQNSWCPKPSIIKRWNKALAEAEEINKKFGGDNLYGKPAARELDKGPDVFLLKDYAIGLDNAKAATSNAMTPPNQKANRKRNRDSSWDDSMTLDCSASKRLEPDCSASYHLPRINLLNWTGEYALHHPWLGPCFQFSKVCLTKLPDLFLSLKTVKVDGSLTEMVFSDLDGRIIASKRLILSSSEDLVQI